MVHPLFTVVKAFIWPIIGEVASAVSEDNLSELKKPDSLNIFFSGTALIGFHEQLDSGLK